MDEVIYFGNNSDTPMSEGRRVTRTQGGRSTGSSSHSGQSVRAGSTLSEGEGRSGLGRLPEGFRVGHPDGIPQGYIDPTATAAAMGPVLAKLSNLLAKHNALHFPAYTYSGEDPSPPHVWQHIPAPAGMRDGRLDFPELLEKRDLIYAAIQNLERGGGATVSAELNGWVVMRRGASVGAAHKYRKTGRTGTAGGGGRPNP
jgi:hypothetical protein